MQIYLQLYWRSATSESFAYFAGGSTLKSAERFDGKDMALGNASEHEQREEVVLQMHYGWKVHRHGGDKQMIKYWSVENCMVPWPSDGLWSRECGLELLLPAQLGHLQSSQFWIMSFLPSISWKIGWWSTKKTWICGICWKPYPREGRM